MVAEAQWAEAFGYATGVAGPIRDALGGIGMRTEWRRHRIDMAALQVDKKRTGAGVRLPIVPAIGLSQIKTVPLTTLADFIERRST